MTHKQSLFEAKSRLFSPKAYSAWRGLASAQSLSSDELYTLNWRRRLALVRHCAASIELYRRKFEEIGFEPGDLKSETDWDRLPILEKSEIRDQPELLVHDEFDIKRLPTATTGGTTGLPLKTYNDPRIHLASMSWRMLEWWGVHPGDDSGYLYRAVPQGLNLWLRDVALWPTKRSYVAASNMFEEEMFQFYRALKASKPTYLVGYVGALEVFARFCSQRGLRISGLDAIWTTASPLGESLRANLEAVFNAPTYTQYGSCELYWIAAECKHKNGMHIGSDVRQVDIDGVSDSTDDFGDVIVSDLLNYAFPLLRYRIGDRGRKLRGSCSCGMPFPRMDYVKGRVSDTLILNDGTSIPGEFWTTIFDDFTDDISAFQVVQKRNGDIQVKYVGNPNGNGPSAANLVLKRLNAQTRNSTTIEIVAVAEIPSHLGKIQLVVRET